jgi:hypothetical protein
MESKKDLNYISNSPTVSPLSLMKPHSSSEICLTFLEELKKHRMGHLNDIVNTKEVEAILGMPVDLINKYLKVFLKKCDDDLIGQLFK